MNRYVAALLAVVAIVGLAGASVLTARRAPEPERPRTAAAVTVPDPVDALFIPAPAGTRMGADDRIDDPERLAFHVGDEAAEVYRRHGFRRFLQRSYYSGPQGGGLIWLVELDDPAGALAELQRVKDGGLGEPYPDLPHGLRRDRASKMEEGLHDVTAHFRTLTFVSGSYVVQVEGYGVRRDDGNRRAAEYARGQHALLADAA